MCGIAGIISGDRSNVSEEQLKRMTDSLHHRGPEGDGFYINETGKVGFGHRRLSIIDLSNAGAQPMQYANRFTITYNGEIYNYKEIKRELQKQGFTFISSSDTEVILAAYAYYGKQCLQYFDGMFAFAIWDEQEQQLFCARDRFGEKPFYFHYNKAQHSLTFASEMKALWAAGIHKKKDGQMLLQYLAVGWVQNPANKQQTFFEDIYALPPSHFIEYKIGEQINLQRYWDIDKETSNGLTGADQKEKFLELFTTSIKRRLRSDVAIGSSLSGGLDSSAIVSMVSKLIDQSEKQKTFSAVFPGFAKDESAHIAQVVQQFSVDNYSVTPTAQGFLEDFKKLAWHQEEPFQSSSIYAQYKVYELAKEKKVTVILDGQGADEIFGGYHKYIPWYLQELIAKGEWKTAQKELQAFKNNGADVSWGFKNYLSSFLPGFTAKQLETRVLKQLVRNKDLTRDFVHSNFDKAAIYKPAVEKLNDILYFNTMQFGLEELLRYADRNSMAHSREVRLPFLNHELVQFVFSVPSVQKMYNGFTKYLLRTAMDNVLPASIVWRKDKVGFEPPQKQWLQHPMVQDYIYESRKRLIADNILDKKVALQKLDNKSAHEENNYDWRYMCAANTLGI